MIITMLNIWLLVYPLIYPPTTTTEEEVLFTFTLEPMVASSADNNTNPQEKESASER